MNNLISYGNEAFLLFTFPLIGLLMQRKLSKKQNCWVLMISFILLVPMLFSYHYTIPYFLRLLLLLILSAAFCLYLYAIEEMKYKVRTAWIASTFIIFLFFGFWALLDAVSGHESVEKTWRVDRYKVEYISDQGFAGGPLMKYKLMKYSNIPILIKEMETTIDGDTTQSCLVNFSKSKLVFNKCHATLEVDGK